MKKPFVIICLLLISACSGGKDDDRIHYVKTSKSSTTFDITNQFFTKCQVADKKPTPCAAVALKAGKNKPAYPLTSTGNIAALLVYDPAFQQENDVSFRIRFDCEQFPKKAEPTTELCLTVEEANTLLKPFYSK